jgi:diguanylate cyclase (GGDEF)-like protein
VDNENDVIEFFTQNNIKNGLSIFYQLKVALIVFFGESSDAIDILKKAEQHVYSRKGFIELQMLLFYGSLIYVRACTVNNPEKINYLNHAKTNIANLKVWALHAPMNFQHKYDLVAAEIARIEGDFQTAARFYEKAIQGAHENGYLNDEALSYELAAEYYLCRNLERIAQTYLIEARFVYQRWGALAKVAQLEKKYPFLQSKKYSSGMSSSATISYTIQEYEQLDVLSIIKASQSIASEIKLERLLQELLKILLANAGASRGVILLPEKEQWLVQADSDNDENSELINNPLDNYNSLPPLLIHYVIRTQEKLLIDNLQDNQFNRDSYFHKNPPLSLLCFPLIQQHRISGIIYLENKLLSNAFTSERVKLLEILSGQIIISIENTLLYRSLEHKVMERTSELNSTISELKLAKNKLSEMAYKDSLTMLYNRRGLDYTLQDSNIFARPLTIILCDIDYFKLINDRHGHSVGDMVIQTFARIIIEITRKTDICVRWGGEEFLILLPLTNEAEAFIVAEKIRVSCEQHLFSGHQGLCFTSSFGICSKKDDHSLDEIIHDADQALYQAKSQGRNQVCVFN